VNEVFIGCEAVPVTIDCVCTIASSMGFRPGFITPRRVDLKRMQIPSAPGQETR